MKLKRKEDSIKAEIDIAVPELSCISFIYIINLLQPCLQECFV